MEKCKSFIVHNKSTKGITLIALVVTIVVLLILAGVSINVLFGDSGLIKKAKESKTKWENAENNEQEQLNGINDLIDGNIKQPGDIIKDTVTNKAVGSDIQDKTIKAEDLKGNQIVIPKGFKISNDSGSTVQQGIVIEDSEKNQFVWIPVSNINQDGSNKIIKDNGDEVEITLGRYTFADDNADIPGEPTIKQKGVDYENTDISISGCIELNNYREANEERGYSGTNTTAKDLETFITKTKENHGYYIARYEASYGSGYNESGSTTSEKFLQAKPLSKKSVVIGTDEMNYTKGTLWNFINQGQAAKASQNMYSENEYVKSDLINSYAWDTAIVYIQKMKRPNYANETGESVSNLKNTGNTGDEVCKIFDMGGNCKEWTTEYNTMTGTGYASCCTYRGGLFSGVTSSSMRGSMPSDMKGGASTTFRVVMYVTQ